MRTILRACEQESEAIPSKAATDVRDSSFRYASFRMTAYHISIVAKRRSNLLRTGNGLLLRNDFSSVRDCFARSSLAMTLTMSHHVIARSERSERRGDPFQSSTGLLMINVLNNVRDCRAPLRSVRNDSPNLSLRGSLRPKQSPPNQQQPIVKEWS